MRTLLETFAVFQYIGYSYQQQSIIKWFPAGPFTYTEAFDTRFVGCFGCEHQEGGYVNVAKLDFTRQDSSIPSMTGIIRSLTIKSTFWDCGLINASPWDASSTL